jgi:HSP20 family protein
MWADMKATNSNKTMNNTITKTEKRPARETATVEHRGYVSPRVNITETKDGYLLEAEMPGVSKEGLEIALEGNELTLVGRRRVENQGLELRYRESTGRDYRRMFVLDPTIDTAKIDAKMENGVLRLHLPKAEQVKPRKITVTE